MAEEPEQQRPDIEKVLGVGKSKTSAWFADWWPALVVVAVIVAAAGGYVLWAWSGSGGSPRYVAEAVTREDITVTVTATGSVQPTNVVEVSSELSGTIEAVHVDHNSKVVKGQELAALDTDKLEATVQSHRAKLAAAKARLHEAEATLAEKELDYERKRRLVERDVVSQHDFEIAKAAYERALAAVESAKADVAAARAELELSETNLAKACICSPINGTVLDRNVEPGQTVATSLQAPTLFTIAEDLTQMEVRVDVDEADVGEVAEGQRATFTVDAYPNKTFSAEIRELRFGSETVQGVVTYKAVLRTENPELLLRPGMTATAEITVQELDGVITIPNEALRYMPEPEETGDDQSFISRLLPGPPRLREPTRPVATGPERQIWVLSEGKPKQVQVTIGPSDGQRTQIVAGDVKPGQRVIVDTAATSS